jgi:hypothetical protein
MALCIITQMPDNPITGRAGPAGNPIALTIEVFAAVFIVLAAAIIIYELQKGLQEVQKATTTTTTTARGKRHLPIWMG